MRKLTSAQINAYVAFFPGEEEKDNIPGLKFPFRYVPSRFYLLGSASRQLDVEKTVVCKHDETGAIHAVSVGSAQTVRRAFPLHNIRTNVPFDLIRSLVTESL